MWTLVMLGCSLFAEPESPPGPAAPTDAPPSVPDATPVGVDPTEPRYAASHILVAWQGAVEAPASVTRSEAEARALAESLRERAASEPFEALAKQHSDDPSGRRGGRLGVWRTGTMVPEFERVVAAARPGELAPLVRTPFGWHVVRRDAIEEVRIAHIQVSWEGALRSGSTRTRDEARRAIDGVRERLAAGEAFAAIARELSDDASASSGGDLGVIGRGQMVPAFEDAAFGLGEGATSDVIETPYGFHLLRRLPLTAPPESPPGSSDRPAD